MYTKTLKYLFYLCLFSIILGPLGAIPLGIPQINVYITDIIVGLICLIWITDAKQAIKLIRIDPIARYFCIFVGICVLSLISSPIHMNLSEKLVSGLYTVRLLSYFFIYLTARLLIREKLITSESILKCLVIIGLILASFGWLQYFFYPDLRNLYYLGWDPHFKRIFSTYLDPNYMGLILVLTLIAIFFTKNKKLSIGSILKSLLIFITLMFTYSRSSFLALVGAVFYFSLAKKNFKLLGGILLVILISAILLPRPGGVGVQLERVFSIKTRIENWQQAIQVFIDHPVLGVGFNTARYAKTEYNFGQDNIIENHAGAGFDNSLLFIAATTGLAGLLTFLLFLRQIFQKGNLFVKSSIVAIIVHSFFLNSLFFPWIMVWMWVIIAVGRSHSGEWGDSRIDSGQARMT